MSDVTMAASEFARLKREAELGREYIHSLKADIKRIGALVGQDSVSAFFADEVNDADKLKTYLAELEKQWDEKMPPRGYARPGMLEQTATPEANRIFQQLDITAATVAKYKDK